MSLTAQTRPRRPPPWLAYVRPVLPGKRTHAGRPDRASKRLPRLKNDAGRACAYQVGPWDRLHRS